MRGYIFIINDGFPLYGLHHSQPRIVNGQGSVKPHQPTTDIKLLKHPNM